MHSSTLVAGVSSEKFFERFHPDATSLVASGCSRLDAELDAIVIGIHFHRRAQRARCERNATARAPWPSFILGDSRALAPIVFAGRRRPAT
jgi:hypothetical protein